MGPMGYGPQSGFDGYGYNPYGNPQMMSAGSMGGGYKGGAGMGAGPSNFDMNGFMQAFQSMLQQAQAPQQQFQGFSPAQMQVVQGLQAMAPTATQQQQIANAPAPTAGQSFDPTQAGNAILQNAATIPGASVTYSTNAAPAPTTGPVPPQSTSQLLANANGTGGNAAIQGPTTPGFYGNQMNMQSLLRRAG